MQKKTRRERANRLARNCLVRIGSGKYLFVKEELLYQVDLETKNCTCPDKLHRGGLCKHLMAAEIIENRLQSMVPTKKAKVV